MVLRIDPSEDEKKFIKSFGERLGVVVNNSGEIPLGASLMALVREIMTLREEPIDVFRIKSPWPSGAIYYSRSEEEIPPIKILDPKDYPSQEDETQRSED